MTDTPLLSSLHLPEDIPGLSLPLKLALAQELRDTIIRVVTKNGGHLAPSLGVVELTIALLSCFDPARDPIVWDVGHQSYPWKLLTGRAERFDTLRRYGGISGFPNRNESPYDYFGVGHASTSISAALGMATARDLRGGKEHVVAVIGDGALSGGMALEALNQAGGMGKRLIVILNDNKMSISENTGALSRFLSRNLSHSTVMHIKQHVARVLSRLPKGETIVDIIRKGEVSFKSFFTPGVLFEAFQFNYIGPINGHDILQLEKHLQAAKELDMPVLLHIRTRKGKGYSPAEHDPAHFHGISASVPDEISTPPQPSGWKPSGPGFSRAFGDEMCALAEKNPHLFAITAAMPDGTGLQGFHERFPERFADVGICEEHAVTFAAGLASRGYHPVVAIYSTFMQRAYDQIIHDVCLQNLPVTLCLDRAGLVGEDGPTHHGAFDLSWLRSVPNLSLAAPRDEDALRQALALAVSMPRPVALRYPRGSGRRLDPSRYRMADRLEKTAPGYPAPGRGELLLRGNTRVCILAAGQRAVPCAEAALLAAEHTGNLASVFDACWVKPLPEEQILALAEENDALLIVEENTLMGGFSSAVLELLADHDALGGLKIRRLGLPDRFLPHGPLRRLRADVGLNVLGILAALEELLPPAPDSAS
ncbi:1-deoxy-D-xylulose-5-phosphate synthase [uncultured Mailhella sp.]|uniref:1-deoxy-D-xylulose-5-phosphate synthase n=1 Tax=uncultured Mailhella sp. TaxID=1981031 RepID=UPI0025F58C57|nr:1-deoxy-D-xylulose-5-phosphate synthase [uncultured Mailhella sp.]